jgi:hypothetical protein
MKKYFDFPKILLLLGVAGIATYTFTGDGNVYRLSETLIYFGVGGAILKAIAGAE